MTLITSISGIRGTIGGIQGENLTPGDIVKFTSAYAFFIKELHPGKKCTIVTGRDGRISGQLVSNLANNTLLSMGIDVIDLGLTTTPTVEIAVTELKTQGGIIFTASHNPEQWNALKLLNDEGEFLGHSEGKRILELAEKATYLYAPVNELGKLTPRHDLNTLHCEKVCKLSYVKKEKVESKNFKVVIDGINSTGSVILPELLMMLGLKKENISVINAEPDGRFAHNPEPLFENLGTIMKTVVEQKADLGIVVDPDVDRLCFVCEDGSLFGEEYTLVAVADYVLKHKPGNTVSNLSSTRALKDVTVKYGGSYTASGVGEVNVVEAMKKVSAVIGGEGNGGVILPDLHFGRDALVGIAIFLSQLAEFGGKVSELRKQYPDYYVSKNKVNLSDSFDFDKTKALLMEKFKDAELNTADGLRIDFPEGWVHIRKSNTEPIVRIYAEGLNKEIAEELAGRIMQHL